MQLVCPAGNFESLKAAINHGADAVYVGLKDNTNARHFPGLNFNPTNIRSAIDYVHAANKKIFVAINTYAQADSFANWQLAVDTCLDFGVDSLIIADMAVLDYARQQSADANLHLSVQGSATNPAALSFYHDLFQVKRAVLPRVLSLAQVRQVAKQSPIELEVFGFGSLCIMAEGRCHLSSYVTGESPNTCGACSPAKYVKWQQQDDKLSSSLNGVIIDSFSANENAGYPTLCKGRFKVGDHIYHAMEEPTSLNTLELLPQLYDIGIKAIKIEGRQRSPAYIIKVTQVWRQAIDACLTSPDHYQTRQQWHELLASLSEGSQTTLGAYHRSWQ